MKMTNGCLLISLLLIWSSSYSLLPSAMANSEASVSIVYTDKPKAGEDPDSYHIHILASVLGSEEAAKEALIYNYSNELSGFSAKLTPDQVSKMSKQPGVLNVVPSKTAHMHSVSQV